MGIAEESQAVVDVEFGINVMEVHFDRTFTDKELLGNFFIPQPPRQQAHNLEFARCQHSLDLLSSPVLLDEFIQHSPHRVPFEPLFSRMDLPDALHEQGRGHLFQHDPADAAANGLDGRRVTQS